MRLILITNTTTGEQSLETADREPIEGVIAATQHTDPNNPIKAWLTVSIAGNELTYAEES